MKISMRIYDNKENAYVEMKHDFLIEQSGMQRGARFEDFGIQSDGQLVVFDKCGTFGYLDNARFELQLIMKD